MRSIIGTGRVKSRNDADGGGAIRAQACRKPLHCGGVRMRRLRRARSKRWPCESRRDASQSRQEHLIHARHSGNRTAGLRKQAGPPPRAPHGELPRGGPELPCCWSRLRLRYHGDKCSQESERSSMTSLAIAVSIDARGPCALYIATDSRFTWETTSKRWDAGQKTFAPVDYPDIFGFCGNAYFPPMALRQMIDLVNAGVIFRPSDTAECRHQRVMEVVRCAIENRAHAPISNFAIFHGARDGELMASRFRAWKTQYASGTGEWTDEELDLSSERSYLAHLDGSGATTISAYAGRWRGTSAEGTSRAAFWAFCDALYSKKDGFSGGPPQLVGIWRKGVARQFGLIWCGKRYLCGVEVPDDARFDSVAWFNQKFERFDGEKIKRLADGKRHPKPSL